MIYENSLNSDCQQCHYYQQNNHISLQLTGHTKQNTTYDVGNPRQAQKCGEAKSINEIPTLQYEISSPMTI